MSKPATGDKDRPQKQTLPPQPGGPQVAVEPGAPSDGVDPASAESADPDDTALSEYPDALRQTERAPKV